MKKHRFLTVERGWVEAQSLTAADRLRTVGLLEAEPDDQVAHAHRAGPPDLLENHRLPLTCQHLTPLP